MSRLPVYAHRGASGAAFENTMKAFMKAYEQGADGLEIDVQLSEDGVPFVIHDPDLGRLAGIQTSIAEMSSHDLENVRVGKKGMRLFAGHPIPTLMEVVSFCAQHNLGLNVELKETVSERPESVREILSMVSLLDQVHISSFDYHLMEKVKEFDPKMETGFLVRKKGVEWEQLERYSAADGFHLHKRLLVEPYIGNLAATGKKIRIYGVTGKELITTDPPPYISGWITDYPNKFLT
ncbi:glycerophosphodiester phosphodiesterase family protein [Sporosarcina sp. HYO08]|uniref:glycerophosphodiester phosphodiesterase n=1 Tax=Sporosarcina sp. HYO08 TaxID=1759557 RepID=UPI00079AA0D1|nr:glycerophosphodiester phosphodiesterase family protein [Sporosarcina sp. HYO08]KXH87495.1 hypothetical protein AU377_02705 [Sporosarcina sp. HYO08]